MSDDSIVSQLLKDCEESENFIKQLRESPPSNANIEEIQKNFSIIRKSYKLLLTKYSQNTLTLGKDIIGQLWKVCFYRQIEDYRKVIKKLGNQISSSENEILKNHLVIVSKEMISFLDDSINFFQNIMTNLEELARSLPTSPDSSLHLEYINSNIYRCLLYLGDLSRYRAPYTSDESAAGYTDSVRYYEKASLYKPFYGNAHNQLAMLAAYNDAESTALYHYCRSVLVKVPFSGGFDNLARLFISNCKTFFELKDSIEQRKSSNTAPSRSRKSDIQRFKFFLSSFVRLQAILFAWSIRMNLEYVKYMIHKLKVAPDSPLAQTFDTLDSLNEILSSSVLKGKSSQFSFDSELEELIESIMEDFEYFVPSARLSEIHMLRFISIAIFTVHFTQKPFMCGDNTSFSLFLQGEIPIGSDNKRSSLQSIALYIAHSLARIAIVRYCNFETKKGSLDKLLSSLAIFSNWLCLHEKSFLSSPTFNSEDFNVKGFELTWNTSYLSSQNMLNKESRALSSLKASLKEMDKVFKKQGMKDELVSRFADYEDGVPHVILEDEEPNGVDPTCYIIIKEHSEFRGYTPFSDLYEKHFKNFDPSKNTVRWMPDNYAKTERLISINRLVEHSYFKSTSTNPVVPPIATVKKIISNPSKNKDEASKRLHSNVIEKKDIQTKKKFEKKDIEKEKIIKNEEIIMDKPALHNNFLGEELSLPSNSNLSNIITPPGLLSFNNLFSSNSSSTTSSSSTYNPLDFNKSIDFSTEQIRPFSSFLSPSSAPTPISISKINDQNDNANVEVDDDLDDCVVFQPNASRVVEAIPPQKKTDDSIPSTFISFFSELNGGSLSEDTSSTSNKNQNIWSQFGLPESSLISSNTTRPLEDWNFSLFGSISTVNSSNSSAPPGLHRSPPPGLHRPPPGLSSSSVNPSDNIMKFLEDSS